MPVLPFCHSRAKRGIFRLTIERLNYEILRVAQDDQSSAMRWRRYNSLILTTLTFILSHQGRGNFISSLSPGGRGLG